MQTHIEVENWSVTVSVKDIADYYMQGLFDFYMNVGKSDMAYALAEVCGDTVNQF